MKKIDNIINLLLIRYEFPFKLSLKIKEKSINLKIGTDNFSAFENLRKRRGQGLIFENS